MPQYPHLTPASNILYAGDSKLAHLDTLAHLMQLTTAMWVIQINTP